MNIDAITNTGRVKQINQDDVKISVNQAGVYLAIVADGVSSQKASGVASRVVTEDIARIWAKTSINQLQPMQQFLASVAEHENTELLKLGQQMTALSEIATTMIAAIILPHQHQVLIANLGDSKALLLHEGKLSQISHDHNVANELARMGKQVDERVANSKAITRYLGLDQQLNVEISLHDVSDGDLLMLTSDGLTNALGFDKIQALLQLGMPLYDKNKNLVDVANALGAADNLTSVLISIE